MNFLDATKQGEVGADHAFAIFDAAEPVDASFLWGTWRGSDFPSGHPMDGSLAQSGWFGKRFTNADHVDPLLFHDSDRTGHFAADPIGAARAMASGKGDLSLIRDEIETHQPGARLRAVEYRGVLSTAMVYDTLPVIDHFRRIDQNTMLGAMDRRGDEATYFFVLRRQQRL